MVLCPKNSIKKNNPDAAKKSYLITKQCEIEQLRLVAKEKVSEAACLADSKTRGYYSNSQIKSHHYTFSIMVLFGFICVQLS